MASCRKPLRAQKKPRISERRDEGKRPQGIEKEAPQDVRRSARSLRLREMNDKKAEQASPSSLVGKIHKDRTEPLRPQTLHKPSTLHRKRKKGQEAGPSAADVQHPPSKRPRTSSPHFTAKSELHDKTESDSKTSVSPIENWVRSSKWPDKCFQPNSQASEDFFNHDSWLNEQMERQSTPVVRYVEINGIKYPRPTPKVHSVRRRPSEASLTGSSNQRTAPYRDNRYDMLLAARDSYMKKSDVGISKASRAWCTRLLNSAQTIPEHSLFRDDKFEKTCGRIENRNEARVKQDVARLIVPSAETLATEGAQHLDHLIENVDEAWTECIPVEGPRPQPDYSVGFQRSAFTDDQLRRFDPFIGSVYDTSYFVATFRMYLPFLTCEVKCGAAALDIADRQNAHSMTLAVRGVVELFRLVKRAEELHQEILGFSVSHDHTSVRIYGHYAIIDGDKTTFYRHPIHAFDFRALDGRDKWTTYQFIRNVYDLWMPAHLERICSVIDQLPAEVDFELSRGSELQFPEVSGLSQEIGGLLSRETNIDSASQTSQDDNELAPIIPQIATPGTSVSREKAVAETRRPKRKHAR